MKAPITTLNRWIIDKIKAHLAVSEGCTILSTEYTLDGDRAVIQDSLGFIYEVSIKTVGRTQNEGPAVQATSTLSFLERVK